MEEGIDDLIDNTFLSQSRASRNDMQPISSQTVPDEAKLKILKARKGVSLNHLLVALKDNDPDKVASIIAGSRHLSSMLTSTKPIKLAVGNNNFELAKELLEHGFSTSCHLINKSLELGEEFKADGIVRYGLYPSDCADLIFWNLLHKNLIATAQVLYLKEPSLQELCTYEELSNSIRINQIVNSEELLEKVFDQALDSRSDKIACLVVQKSFLMVTFDRVQKALENSCIDLLKILCSGNNTTPVEMITEKMTSSAFWQFLNKSDDNENSLKSSLKISNILLYYLERQDFTNARKIITWPMVKKSLKIFKILMTVDSEDLAKEFIQTAEIRIEIESFSLALETEKFETCRAMLLLMPEELEISSFEIQTKLIAMLENGYTALLAIDILSRIRLRVWNYTLTRDLCAKLNLFAKKKPDLHTCTAPILHCVLVAQVMEKMKSKIQFAGRCTDTQETYLDLALSLQEACTEESSLQYFMTQTDTCNRSVLQIIAKNKFYSLLENDQVGIIITKMWIGSEKAFDIDKASSIVSSFNAPFGSEESVQFQYQIDLTKSYVFQFQQWKNACNLRYAAFSLSILFLLIIYQIMIYTAAGNNNIENIPRAAETQDYLIIIFVWVFGIDSEQVLRLIFAKKTKRKIKFDSILVTDLLISLLVIVIIIDLPELYIGPGKYFPNGDRYLTSALLHCAMILLLCIKYLSLLLVSKSFGQFLSMALLVFRQVLTFFVIYIGFTLCTAAVFTLLFHDMAIYSRVDYSLRTLFMATIGPFDITIFESHPAFGPVMLAIYLLLAHILLLNLLVGIINNVFNGFQDRVESEYYSVIIKTYYKDHWDEKYGMMVFLPTPFTALALLLAPVLIFSKKPEFWNEKISKALYLVYALPQFAIFIFWSAVYFIPLYIKGFIIYGKTGTQVLEKKGIQIFELIENDEVKYVVKFSFLKSFAWTFIGVFWLLFAFFRDSFHFWKITLFSADVPEEEAIDPIIDDVFIKNIRKSIRSIKVPKVTPEELFNVWYFFDKVSNQNNTEDRLVDAIDFIRKFANPSDRNLIDLAYMKKIFTKQIGDIYDKEYKKRLQNFNFASLNKALITFERKTGMIKKLRQIKLDSQQDSVAFGVELEDLEQNIANLKSISRSMIKECKKFLRFESE